MDFCCDMDFGFLAGYGHVVCGNVRISPVTGAQGADCSDIMTIECGKIESTIVVGRDAR